MRTVGVGFVLCALGGAAFAQRHTEGVEPGFQAQKLAIMEHQAAQAADMLENTRERQRHLLTDLYASDHGHAELMRMQDSVRIIRQNSHEVEVRHRQQLNYNTRAMMARQNRERQRILFIIKRAPMLRPTPRVANRLGRQPVVRPLTPTQMGRLPPGRGTPRIGTPSISIRFIPPGG